LSTLKANGVPKLTEWERHSQHPDSRAADAAAATSTPKCGTTPTSAHPSAQGRLRTPARISAALRA